MTAEQCRARAALAAGAQHWAGGTGLCLFEFFSVKGLCFLAYLFYSDLINKDQFLQLVRDPSGAPHFIGWLPENDVFSHKGWLFQEGGVCVSHYRAEVMLCSMQTIYFLILHCVLTWTYLFSVEA